MNIGIIGAGNVGTGLAKRLLRSGHSVLLSFSKDRAALADTAQALGARSGKPSEAVAFADVVVLATPWLASAEALAQVGNVTNKKILWDCTNALKPDLSGLLIGTTTSGGEEVAKLAPWAHVVKAIPPFAEQLHAEGGLAGSVFVCGDDANARQAVMQLVQDIGAVPVDAGPLRIARYTEPTCMLAVHLAYHQNLGPRIGLSLARETDR